jgi:hypothetical protein
MRIEVDCISLHEGRDSVRASSHEAVLVGVESSGKAAPEEMLLSRVVTALG